MVIEKMTRALLRNIPLGKSRKFILPNGGACEAAKTLAYQLQRIDGVKFRAKTDYDKLTVVISKEKKEQ